MQVYVAEFVGTMILILLGDGVVANVLLNKSKAHNSGWMVIATGWGLAVAIAVYSVGNISGGHINPAVTLALAAIGEFPWAQVPGYIIAQILGAGAGAVLVYLAFFAHWKETDDPDAKLGIFCTGPAIRHFPANFTTELIGTAMLLFGVLAIGAGTAHFKMTGDIDLSEVFSIAINPLLVGFLVWGIGLSLGGPTGYAINPARDLGPRIAHALLPIPGKRDSDWGYSWVPIVAPIVGGVLAAFVFKALDF
jgi:glycerol uptake facilitator protein